MGSVADYVDARQATHLAAGRVGTACERLGAAGSLPDAGRRAAALRADRVALERVLVKFYAALDAQVEALESSLAGGE